MTGPEHYQQAETWLGVAAAQGQEHLKTPDETTISSVNIMRASLETAQVHATLALAAATAFPIANLDEWREAIQ